MPFSGGRSRESQELQQMRYSTDRVPTGSAAVEDFMETKSAVNQNMPHSTSTGPQRFAQSWPTGTQKSLGSSFCGGQQFH